MTLHGLATIVSTNLADMGPGLVIEFSVVILSSYGEITARSANKAHIDRSIRVVFLLAALYLLSANYVVWMRALLSLCLDEWFQYSMHCSCWLLSVFLFSGITVDRLIACYHNVCNVFEHCVF